MYGNWLEYLNSFNIITGTCARLLTLAVIAVIILYNFKAEAEREMPFVNDGNGDAVFFIEKEMGGKQFVKLWIPNLTI